LVSSNSSSDYTFGIFKLLLITLLVSSNFSSDYSFGIFKEKLEDTKRVIRREA
jgi:hypothetical protein